MKQVLIIDDDPDVLLTLKRMLEPEEFDVVTAKDGKEGMSFKENVVVKPVDVKKMVNTVRKVLDEAES